MVVEPGASSEPGSRAGAVRSGLIAEVALRLEIGLLLTPGHSRRSRMPVPADECSRVSRRTM